MIVDDVEKFTNEVALALGFSPAYKRKELFHYCSMETMVSIVENRNIRVCEAIKTNDTREITWGIDKFKNQVQQSYVPKDLSQEFIKQIEKAQSNTRIFVSCFSESKDALSQWRSYADDGNGVSLGFKLNNFAKHNVFFSKVIYQESEQIRSINTFVKNLVEACANKFSDKQGDVIDMAAHMAIMMCAEFKNDAFSEEKEVRIIDIASNYNANSLYSDINNSFEKGIHTRIFKNFLSHYLKCPLFGNDPISTVVLGPKNQNRPSDIENFFRIHGFDIPSVVSSKATYR